MHKRKLGNSGLEIAPLVLGGNVFGWTADKDASFAVLDVFVDALSAAGVEHTVIDAVGLSHEEVNDRVGEASDSTLTPEVEAFFAQCLAKGAS